MIKVLNYEIEDCPIIEEALTHSSFSSVNYERLEFLGDSILDFVVASILFKRENLNEDELTRSRANIVDEEALSIAFDKLNLAQYVRLGKACTKITRAMKCDMYESVTASIYLLYGLDECITFIKKTLNFEPDDHKDYKTAFQEYAQKYKKSFNYNLDKTEGPAHDLSFYVSLYIEGEHISSAVASSKVAAEKLCAKQALEKFKDKE